MPAGATVPPSTNIFKSTIPARRVLGSNKVPVVNANGARHQTLRVDYSLTCCQSGVYCKGLAGVWVVAASAKSNRGHFHMRHGSAWVRLFSKGRCDGEQETMRPANPMLSRRAAFALAVLASTAWTPVA